jgi:hypothetical protein
MAVDMVVTVMVAVDMVVMDTDMAADTADPVLRTDMVQPAMRMELVTVQLRLQQLRIHARSVSLEKRKTGTMRTSSAKSVC